MVKRRISFRRKGKKISFLRKPRKKLKRPKLRASKKVYKRKILRNKYGEFMGSRKSK